ncbi:hypothetical protein V8C37DRAFT_386654 [Trichoderma ceciliae]
MRHEALCNSVRLALQRPPRSPPFLSQTLRKIPRKELQTLRRIVQSAPLAGAASGSGGFDGAVRKSLNCPRLSHSAHGSNRQWEDE